MIPDLAGFRRLLGVAPDGKLALLDALLTGGSSREGGSSPEDLVSASGLPRRDVEEFTEALGLPGAESSGADLPGAGSSGAADRDAIRKLLAEYRASRARIRADDEGDLERVAAELIAGVPAPRKRFDHVQATPATLVRRVAWLTGRFDLSGRSVLLAGDHDLTSLLLAWAVPDADITVADIDEQLLAYVDSRSAGKPGAGKPGVGRHGAGRHGAGRHGGGRVRCVWADFRFGLPPALAESADVVFTDPPYTPEGLGLFLSRSVSALSRRDPGGRIVVAYGHSRRRPDLGLAAQREIARQDLVIDAMLPGFSRYAGAQAVGSASDLYCLQPAASAFRHGGAHRPQGSHQQGARQQGIYTHGEHSVESGAANAADLIPLLPRLTFSGAADAAAGVGDAGRSGLISPEPGTARGFAVSVSLGKLLADGVHPSVTGRAKEFVVDLRDDPGPWLLRAMLALNAERAVFVVPRRHEALARLTDGAGEWDLLRAKFASISPVPVGDLVAVRCALAPAPYSGRASTIATGTEAAGAHAAGPESAGTRAAGIESAGAEADPGLGLARFVARRAHGRLRNVWREGLIDISGSGTLTKRHTSDLVAQHAGDNAAALALRLIDIPAARFPALHRALVAAAAAARCVHRPEMSGANTAPRHLGHIS